MPLNARWCQGSVDGTDGEDVDRRVRRTRNANAPIAPARATKGTRSTSDAVPVGSLSGRSAACADETGAAGIGGGAGANETPGCTAGNPSSCPGGPPLVATNRAPGRGPRL